MIPEKDVRGLLIAAPSSGSGKTTLTLALLRALKNAGLCVRSAKSGPDYIDPGFHQVASGEVCINLDAWAMSPGCLRALAYRHAACADFLVVEGAMGLFDGASNGQGSCAQLSEYLGLPIILVVDCTRQAQSVAALVSGFAGFRSQTRIAGLILNRVGSTRHETMLRQALDPLNIPVLGVMPSRPELALPERHLGLVQAGEHAELELFLERAAGICTQSIDLSALEKLAAPLQFNKQETSINEFPPPLGQHIAVAHDVAFSFAYPHLLQHWLDQGAEISFFSPLADEMPCPSANAIYLPGGYPELYAQQLCEAQAFKLSIQNCAVQNMPVYGECGGYMALGKAIIDHHGNSHEMLGLLPLVTSFARKKRHLGYRNVRLQQQLPVSGWREGERFAAHEFHYASVLEEGGSGALPLFSAQDAQGNELEPMGLHKATVWGSFAHLICKRQ